MWLIKKIGSLSFTILITVLLIGLLIVSTSMESFYGTKLVQKTFYQTKWFDAFLSLLWLNIFCSTILRFPFKKRHAGFIITHVGILGLLLGALLTRLFGVEGQLMLFEGESSNLIQTGGYELKVAYPNGKKEVMDLDSGYFDLPPVTDNLKISVGKILEQAVEEPVFSEGEPDLPQNHALRVHFRSSAVKVDQSFWLVENNPLDVHSSITMMGPAMIGLEEGGTALLSEQPLLEVLDGKGERLAKIDLSGPVDGEISLGESGLKITSLRYYPFARVEGKNLANGPEGSVPNPAVEFDVSDGQGNSMHYVHFAFFPEFESMHAMPASKTFDITVNLRTPYEKEKNIFDGPYLTFYFWPDNKWTYRSSSKNGNEQEKDFKANEWTPLDWMDIEFRVEEVLARAVISRRIKESDDAKGSVFAAEVLIHDGKEHHARWLTAGEMVRLKTGEGDVRLVLFPRERALPFSLVLHDFRKEDYPGTDRPAAFESDVTIQDIEKKVELSRTISMNRPLDYKGYRIFQSSFMKDPMQGEASIFTVAKNPGISFIYLFSCTIFVGAMFQFYGKNGGDHNDRRHNGF